MFHGWCGLFKYENGIFTFLAQLPYTNFGALQKKIPLPDCKNKNWEQTTKTNTQGDSGRDLFGMMKKWPFGKGFFFPWPPKFLLDKKIRSRLSRQISKTSGSDSPKVWKSCRSLSRCAWKFEVTRVFPKIGVPQNGWFIRENPIKMYDLGVPLFSETSTRKPTKDAFLETMTDPWQIWHIYLDGDRWFLWDQWINVGNYIRGSYGLFWSHRIIWDQYVCLIRWSYKNQPHVTSIIHWSYGNCLPTWIP